MGTLLRNAKPETKKLVSSTKKNVERMTAKSFVKLLPKNVRLETTNPVKFTKKNVREISMIIAQQLKRSAKLEIRSPAISTKRNVERSIPPPLTSIATH